MSSGETVELLNVRRLDETNSTSDDGDLNTEILVHSLRVYGIFFICAFPIYCFVRRRFPQVYAMRQHVEKIKNSLAMDQFGYISWVWKVHSFTEQELLEHTALDTVCFLRLMKMGLRMACVGCFNSIWLFPVYATTPAAAFEEDVFNKASINVLPDGSHRFLAPVLATYIFYGYAVYTILKEFSWFIDQRHIWLKKFNQRNYTIFIRNIPPEMRSNAVLKGHFKLLYGEDSIVKTHLLLHTSALESEVSKRKALIAKLEHALAEQAVCGERPTHRPVKRMVSSDSINMGSVDTINEYTEELQKMNDDIDGRIDKIERMHRPKKQSSASVISCDSCDSVSDDGMNLEEVGLDEAVLTLDNPKNSPVKKDSGLMSVISLNKGKDMAEKLAGQGFEKSIEAAQILSAKSKKMAKKRKKQARHLLAKTQDVTMSVLGTGEEGEADDAAFVTFRNLVSVHAALQMSQHHQPFMIDVSAAPDTPDFLFWGNLGKDREAVQTGMLISACATVALCFLWTIPVTAIVNLTNKEYWTESHPGLEQTFEEKPWIPVFFAILSPLLLLIFNTSLLPILLKLVSRFEFPASDSLLEASAFWKMAAFNIIQTFFVSLISDSILGQLEEIVKDPSQIMWFLAEALPESSAFFMQLMFVSTCVGTTIELFRVVPIVQSILRRFVGYHLTEKERQQNAGPFKPLCDVDKFYYSRTQARFLLYYMVMFVYCSISPLVNWFSVLFFCWLGSVFRYQLVFNYPPTPDSGGEIWLYFVKVLLACMVIAQITLIGYFSLKKARGAAIAMIPLFVCFILFIIYLHQRHFTIGKYLPARSAITKDLENEENGVDYDSFENEYKNPALMVRRQEPDWDAGKAEALLRSGAIVDEDDEEKESLAEQAVEENAEGASESQDGEEQKQSKGDSQAVVDTAGAEESNAGCIAS